MIKLLNIVYILHNNIKDSGFRQKLQCTAKLRMIYEGIAVSCIIPTGSIARKLKKQKTHEQLHLQTLLNHFNILQRSQLSKHLI